MTRRSALPDLAKVPLFSACSKKDLQQINRRAEHVLVPAGKVLVREGAAGAEFFVILAGTAEGSMHGKKVATLGAGPFFGGLALQDEAPSNATVTAETRTELRVLGKREFAARIDGVPG